MPRLIMSTIRAEAEQVEGDPFRAEQEPVHLGDEGTGDGQLPSPRMDDEDVTTRVVVDGAGRRDRIDHATSGSATVSSG